MGFTKNDIEMLRAEIPAQYRVSDGNASMGRLLRQDFVRADDAADSGPGGADPRTAQDEIAGADVAQPNRDMVKERIATEEQIQREIADGTGSITNLTVRDTAQWTSLAQTAAQKEKDKKGGIDITTQLVLLQQQIEALQRQIDFYEGENDRLRDEIDEIDQLAADIRAGRVDPVEVIHSG